MMSATIERSDNRPIWMVWDDDTVAGIMAVEDDDAAIFDFVAPARKEEELGINLEDPGTVDAIITWAMEAAQELQELVDEAEKAGSEPPTTKALLADLDAIIAGEKQ